MSRFLAGKAEYMGDSCLIGNMELVPGKTLASLIPPDEFMMLQVQRLECANAFVFDPPMTPSAANLPMDKVPFYCLLALINIVTPNSRMFCMMIFRCGCVRSLCPIIQMVLTHMR